MSFYENMQLKPEEKEIVKLKFAEMQSVDDLVNLLNLVNPLLYPINHQRKVTQIRKKDVLFFSNSLISSENRYLSFSIKKKSGGERRISAPVFTLKLIQTVLNTILNCVYEPREYVTGFVPQKSIVDNAKIHTGKNYVFNIDLKDFFPSIELHRIKKVLMLEPFSLSSSKKIQLKVRKFTLENGETIVIKFREIPKVGIITGKRFFEKNKLYVYKIEFEEGFFEIFDKKVLDKSSVVLCYQGESEAWKMLEYKSIEKALKNKSFEDLLPTEINQREKLAFLIANLCCHVENISDAFLHKDKSGNKDLDRSLKENLKQRAFLPQGSPTSPIISNIICQNLDRRLNGLSKKVGAKFSRYADDITFSANKDVFNLDFKTEMRRIIEDQKFTINESKVRLQGLGHRQEVTGLIVNEKVNVSKKYIREVRAMLNNWEKLGYEKASVIFKQFYKVNKGHVKNESAIFRNVLWGKLQFLKMVRGKEDPNVMKYWVQFERLANKKLKIEVDIFDKLEKLLSIWEKDGLDSAITDE